MILGDLIKEYRTIHKLSLRDFAQRCGLSHTYISALEKNIDSRTGKPIAPTLDTVKYISKGMNLSIEEILKILNISLMSLLIKINHFNLFVMEKLQNVIPILL